MQRSLRVLLASIGSRGDVQPMLALAQTLRARGHRTTLAAPVDFESWITAQGFDFAPLGDDMQSYLRQHPQVLTGNTLTMLREATRYLKANMATQALQLRAACIATGAEVLVYGGLCLPIAPSISEGLGLPALRLNYSTAITPSRAYPPPAIPWRGLPHWFNGWLWAADRLLARRIMGPVFNAMRADLGLTPVVNFWDHLHGTIPALNVVDEALFTPGPHWRDLSPYANFLFFHDPTPLDPELDAWLRDGPAPVHVGFGSMSGPGTTRVARMLVEAVQACGLRCLIGAGWAGLDAAALPADWRVVREAPHALLFPRCAVVVHHGGSGTMGQALRAGVPQVVLPLILDQFHHAHLLHLAGLAPRPVPMEKVTAPQLTGLIQSALALPAAARQAAAHRLQQSDACADVARRVEAMVADRSGGF